jgi:putative tryptophan/tyrosine transport system substrate-binding protein
VRRREFITLLGGAVAAWPLAARAQQRNAKFAKVGVLWPVDEDQTLHAFQQGLSDLGYIDGQNVIYERRLSRGNHTLLPALASELVRLDVDVIVTWGVTAGLIAKQATTSIPIVNGAMSDPVRAGLVEGLARPGGNLTGLTSASPDLSAKRLQLIKELVPALSRVAVLTTTAPTATFTLQETEAAARLLGIGLQASIVHRPEEFADAYATMARAGTDGLIVLPDLMFDEHLIYLIELAAKHRFPAMYYTRSYVEAGGLMSYGPSYPQLFRRAAAYVDKILRGEKPGELPVEQAVAFDLILNMKTARALGLEIPPGILIRAGELIE